MKRRDNTPAICLVIVLLATGANIGKIAPIQPQPKPLFWECWLMPYLPWCLPPDPPNLPKPKPAPIPVPPPPPTVQQ